jgi:hypothetical protein
MKKNNATAAIVFLTTWLFFGRQPIGLIQLFPGLQGKVTYTGFLCTDSIIRSYNFGSFASRRF